MDRLRQTRRVDGMQNGTSTAVCVRAGLVAEDWFELQKRKKTNTGMLLLMMMMVLVVMIMLMKLRDS